MATRQTPAGGDTPSRDASGQHQGLKRPADDQRVEQALRDADLDELGENVEDQLRDRRGSGLPPDVRSDRGTDERKERR